ncbi:MAG: hypothetical protein V2A79_08670 [Planctomycetota bacterium]
MKRFGTVLAVGLMIATCTARADDFFWEDGTSTILGMYPALGVTATNVAAPDPVHAGSRSLKLVRNSTATAEAFVGWVTGLTDGAQVTASFWRYDTTPGVGPSCRLWGSYTYGGGINRYAGGAGGDESYGSESGWDQTTYTWTFDSDGGTRDGLRIEARVYFASGAIVWVDDISVQAPDGATIYLPNDFPLPPVPPLAHGRFTTMMRNGAKTSIALCSEADTGFSVDHATIPIAGLPANGKLYDGMAGAEITLVPYNLTTGDKKTVGYLPTAGYSGLDTFDFTVTDNHATPLTSAEATHEVGVQAGGVVISEVMHTPSSFQSDYEFVEIFNYSGSAVYLTTLDTTPGPYNMPTENNLANAVIPNGAMKIIAIDDTLDYPESAWVLSCEWGLRESQATWYSLMESDIIRVPVANWEFLTAYPNANCTLTEGSRLLLFGKVGGTGNPVVLLDGLDLARPDALTCSGSSYAVNPDYLLSPPLTADNNDDPELPWWCHATFDTDGGRMTGVTGDQASPGYVPTRLTAPDYDDPCLGACCDPDGCTANVQERACQDACGIWRGKDSPCGYDQNFVNCLELGGPGVTASNYCRVVFDLDSDGDVDLKDFAWFQQGNICSGWASCGTIADEGYIDYPDQREACVTGIVVHEYDMIRSGVHKNFYIQDQTGTRAMSVYGSNACIDALLPTVNPGDLCTFRGTHAEYYDMNLQEFNCNYGAIQVCNCVPVGVPTPLDLTVQQLMDPFLPGENDPRRAYIGMLVRITNARVMGGGTFWCAANYTIQDWDNSSYTMILRTAATGLPICSTTKPAESVRVSIVGILGTFNNAFQIMPRTGYLAGGSYPTYDITQYTP